MKLGARFRALILSLILACTGLALTAAPAQAEVTMRICNSASSFTRIAVKSWGFVGKGNCSGQLPNGSNQIRVDTDPDGPSHSYKIDPIGAGEGPCHTDSDNHSSDPPNGYVTVYYTNFDHGNCTN